MTRELPEHEQSVPRLLASSIQEAQFLCTRADGLCAKAGCKPSNSGYFQRYHCQPAASSCSGQQSARNVQNQ